MSYREGQLEVWWWGENERKLSQFKRVRREGQRQTRNLIKGRISIWSGAVFFSRQIQGTFIMVYVPI
ncbi:unnamed protein product [Linum tenue]|uniref:Uncharacterized protein n=1 Tax=Linum tenue TaxID=586396 RepID=A0AAV0JQ75_9ROSI|nr:unnamed protein product [Linum tenue]